LRNVLRGDFTRNAGEKLSPRIMVTSISRVIVSPPDIVAAKDFSRTFRVNVGVRQKLIPRLPVSRISFHLVADKFSLRKKRFWARHNLTFLIYATSLF
jgi:hypothetical protein